MNKNNDYLLKTFKNNQINKINNMNIHKQIKNIKMLLVKNNYNNYVNKLIKKRLKVYNNKALLCGLNYIGTSSELFGCINDTNNIKNILTQKFNYKYFNILTDKTNKKPIKKNIINELSFMLDNSKPNDKLFFLFSGHGTYKNDLNGDEIDGQDELIVPLNAYSDKNYISDDDLKIIVTKKLKPGVKLFMLFDSCFSGTIMDLKYNYLVDNNSLVVNPKNSETLGQVITISGCNDSQTSSDAYVNISNSNMYSGAMTYAFIKTIQDLGSSISLNDLLINMREILINENFTQIPQLSSGTNIDINTPINLLF